MVCPKCGSSHCVVVTTRESKNTVERHRQCADCSEQIYTSEVVVEDRSRFQELDTANKREYGSAKEIVFEDVLTDSTAVSMILAPNVYQKKCLRTANRRLTSKQQLMNGLMGLNGEAGEAIDILKKHFFQGHDLDKEHVAKELGDVAWYLAISAYALGYKLEDVLQMNIDKLKARYPDKFDSKLSINRKAGDI